MNMVFCRECGIKIQNTLHTCPECNAQQQVSFASERNLKQNHNKNKDSIKFLKYNLAFLAAYFVLYTIAVYSNHNGIRGFFILGTPIWIMLTIAVSYNNSTYLNSNSRFILNFFNWMFFLLIIILALYAFVKNGIYDFNFLPSFSLLISAVVIFLDLISTSSNQSEHCDTHRENSNSNPLNQNLTDNEHAKIAKEPIDFTSEEKPTNSLKTSSYDYYYQKQKQSETYNKSKEVAAEDISLGDKIKQPRDEILEKKNKFWDSVVVVFIVLFGVSFFFYKIHERYQVVTVSASASKGGASSDTKAPNDESVKVILSNIVSSAKQGVPKSQFLLGIIYEENGIHKTKTELDGMLIKDLRAANGSGLTKEDNAQAVIWYRKAADQGFEDAQNFLGDMYAKGAGVATDNAQAVNWYRKAADQGLAEAQNNLGQMYANGQGVSRDDYQAVRLYRKAADQGLAVAQCNLGLMYANGTGVTKDDLTALSWLQKAAEQGGAIEQTNLGVMYAKDGIVHDDSLAVVWYRKAADQGLAEAQNNLGQMYANGQGVSRDDDKAYKLFKEAAAQGYLDAEFNQSEMMAAGRGVAQDFAEARAIYEIANASREYHKMHEQSLSEMRY